MKLTLAKLAGICMFLWVMAQAWNLQQRLMWAQIRTGVRALWSVK